MRIVVDFQAAQTGSRFRGIGRYSTELVRAIAKLAQHDEVILALNGAFPDTIEPIRAKFDGLIPQRNIRVWHAPDTGGASVGGNKAMREIAQIIREFYLRSLEPDLIVICSLFEGLDDPAVVTVKRYVRDVPTAAIFYDLTPLIMPDERFRRDASARRWYRDMLGELSKCDLLLSISENSRTDLLRLLDYPADKVTTILGGVDAKFAPAASSEAGSSAVLNRYGITKPFILYAGGFEPNKNLGSLLESLAILKADLRSRLQMVIVGKREPGDAKRLETLVPDRSVASMLKPIGHVPEDDLIALYRECELFVFPSLREGLGLPPAEAMACGAPTITSNRTSLPEVVGNQDALFDPEQPQAIAAAIEQALMDPAFRKELAAKGLARARELTWEKSATAALQAIKGRFSERQPRDPSRQAVVMRTRQFTPRRLRILVLKLDHNGDFLLAVPAFAKLRARYPDAQIDVVIGSWNRAAAEATDFFTNIYTLDYFKALSAQKASLDDRELRALTERLPFYDYAIDFRRPYETRFLLVEMPAADYFGYRTRDPRLDDLLTNPLEIHPDDGGARSLFDETHASAQILRIVDALPFEVNDYVQLPKLGEKRPKVAGSVAVFPRVGNDARQWESKRFGQLIDELAADPMVARITLYAGRTDELAVIPYKPDPKIHVNAGLSFGDLFASVSEHQVCVGNNSFGVHLAGYAGTRTIALYSGHEIAEQWGPPFGDSLAVSIDAACAPCHLPDRASCPFDVLCLGDISVEVIEGLVRDAVMGREIPEDYSRIVRKNPASVLKPLLDAGNRSHFAGRFDDLSADERVELAAALSINFPERGSSLPHLYIDASALVGSNDEADLRQAAADIKSMLRSVDRSISTPVLIAAGARDREFYAIQEEDFENQILVDLVSDAIARPLPGDAYVAPHVYEHRRPALWDLLNSWHGNGVRIAARAPTIGVGEDTANRPADYLRKIAQWDLILVGEEDQKRVQSWLRRNALPARRASKLLTPEALAADLGILFREGDVPEPDDVPGSPSDEPFARSETL